MPQPLDDLIFDRTQADVSRVKTITQKLIAGNATTSEVQEWLSGQMKGAYNDGDLNRVESAVNYLQEHLNALPGVILSYLTALGVADDIFFRVPYAPLNLTVKTDWEMSDIPLLENMERYLTNVEEITSAIAIERDLPETMGNLTWQGANEIERALSAEYSASLTWEAEKKQYADNTAAAWFYSGDLFCGEI